MVRYIKDGAYTIVVDDAAAPAKKGAKGEGEESGKEDDHPSSPHHQEKEEEFNDNIDYANPAYVLQNLSLTMPTYEQDRTHMLRGRADVAEIIAQQIAFFVFLALQPFTLKPEITPQILVLGDGFIGARVIETLAENQCIPLLRIFTRGDISAKEWRAKGFQAGCNLPALVNKHKPAIFVICAEYSSFHLINHQLAEFDLLSPTACVITSTLGFQRKKLFHNLKIPTILRTYVEPQETLKSYRSKLQQQLQDLWKFDFKRRNGQDEEEEQDELAANDEQLAQSLFKDNERRKTGMFPLINPDVRRDAPPLLEETLSLGSDSLGLKLDADEDSLASENTEENLGIDASLDSTERAVKYIVRRMQGVKSLMDLMENYYMLHDMSFAEARRLSLRVILGYMSVTGNNQGEKSRERGSSRRKERSRAGTSQLSKRAQVVVRLVEKICLSLLTSFGSAFQKEFSKFVPMRELADLDEEPLRVENAQEKSSGPELMVDSEGRHYYVKDDKIQRLSAPNKINPLLGMDDDYSQLHGPSFDYMRALDLRTRSDILEESSKLPQNDINSS